MEPAKNDIVPMMKHNRGNMMYADAVERRKEKFARAGSDWLKGEQARKVLSEIKKQNPPGRFLRETNRRGKYEVIRDDMVILRIIKDDLTKNNPYFDMKPTVRRPVVTTEPSFSKSNEDLSLLIRALKKKSESDTVTEKDPKERVMLAAQKELNGPVKPSEERKEALKKIIKGLSEGDKFITSVVENEMKITLERRAPERWTSVTALDHTVNICCD